jgi:hypothetical protein
MATTYPRFAYERHDGRTYVRSLLKPKRRAIEAKLLLRQGRWPNGELLSGSDAYDIARYLSPARDRRAAAKLVLRTT